MGPSTDRYSAREFHSTRQGRTGAYKGTERTLQPLPLASGPPHTPTWPDWTGPDQWLSYRGRPRAAVADPLQRTQPRHDGSALETRADALSGRCARCRGDLERAVPGPGTGASGRALGGGWRDHLATCQGSKVATRRQIEGIAGQGEAGSGSGGGSSVDRAPIFTPMRRPWHPSRGRSEGPAARGAGRRTNGCQPAQRMSTPAAVRLMSQHRPAGVSHAAHGKCAAFGDRLIGSSGPPGGERGSLVDMLLTLCCAQRIWQRLLKWHAQIFADL